MRARIDGGRGAPASVVGSDRRRRKRDDRRGVTLAISY